MATLARDIERFIPSDVTVSDEEAWAAFERRDRNWDGRVIGAVKTTGIYCKPSCPARRPKREHVDFFADASSALAAGYRACLRCRPDDIGRDREAVAKAVRLIERSEEAPNLTDLAAEVAVQPLEVAGRIGRLHGELRAPGLRPPIDRDPGAVGPAVGELDEHRREVGPEPCLDVARLREQPDDPAHGVESTSM